MVTNITVSDEFFSQSKTNETELEFARKLLEIEKKRAKNSISR